MTKTPYMPPKITRLGSREATTDGGPAFPPAWNFTDAEPRAPHGMTLRDYFAAACQEDDRLVKCVRAMDDEALQLFGLHADSEREEWITEVAPVDWLSLPDEVAKVARRLQLEAKAIARVRYMQADAMLKERDR